MTTTFRLRQDEINESFLAKLRGLFAREDELQIVVSGSKPLASNGANTPAKNGTARSRFDENYLNSKIALARQSWKGLIDPDAWLRELRGYNNE